MTLLARLRSFLRAAFRRSRLEQDMDAELEFHVDARTEDLIAEGLAPAAARQRARDEFGDRLRWKEGGREARGLGLARRTTRRLPARVALASPVAGICRRRRALDGHRHRRQHRNLQPRQHRPPRAPSGRGPGLAGASWGLVGQDEARLELPLPVLPSASRIGRRPRRRAGECVHDTKRRRWRVHRTRQRRARLGQLF